jgi:hypothetical protein
MFLQHLFGRVFAVSKNNNNRVTVIGATVACPENVYVQNGIGSSGGLGFIRS